MARRNQGINVKVARVKVIKALEQALVKLNTNYKNQEANEAKYEAEVAKWEKQILKQAIAKYAKARDVRVNVRYNSYVNIDFDLPAGAIKIPDKPERNFEKLAEYQYDDSKNEIENAIRVLKMCDDEFISTATYGGITKYL